jgi:protein TonB
MEASLLDKRELLTTVASAEDQATNQDEIVTQELINPLTTNKITLDDLTEQIASLEARIAFEQQEQARRPRVKRLTSVSTKSADEAAYLNMWRRKVERIGNANYPDSTVYGDLRMLVVLRYDGSLTEVRILESSGHKSLDNAALRIVRLAAPYPDFPVEMRKHYDQLEIIRTWKFSRSGTTLDS